MALYNDNTVLITILTIIIVIETIISGYLEIIEINRISEMDKKRIYSILCIGTALIKTIIVVTNIMYLVHR